MNMKNLVSIILPTYKESKNIQILVPCIVSNIIGYPYEIIIVDDNSKDGIEEVVRSLRSNGINIDIIIRKYERGLASALKTGILASHGDIVILMDSDLSHDPKILPSMIDLIINGFDIVVGSRYVEGASFNGSKINVIGSRILNLFIRTLLGLPIKDVTGGFLAIRRKIIEEIIERKLLDDIFEGYGDYCFDLLYFAHNVLKSKIKEIPFSYKQRVYGYSKTKIIRTGIKYAFRAIKIRVRKYG